MTSRINKSAVREYVFATIKSRRPHLAGKKTRIAPEFFERADAHLAQWIIHEIETLPSPGKTIR